MITVQLQLITEMLGTVPKDDDIYRSYVESKRPDTGEDEVDIQTIEEKGWTGFHSDAEGLFIFEYMIKGFLKHWGNVLKESLKLKAVKSKIDNLVFISPRKIRFLSSVGNTITEPHGTLSRPLRAYTPQGYIVAIAKSDYVNADSIIAFNIEIIDNGKKEITPDIVKTLLEKGVYSGFGQFRNGGFGRFRIVEFEEK